MLMMQGGHVLLNLKMALLRRGIRQVRMAVHLGWDPAKLSRIINRTIEASADERAAIARYLKMSEASLFPESARCRMPKVRGIVGRQNDK